MNILAQNTYITLEDARLYAADFGLELPDDDTEAEVVLSKATRLIDRMYGNRFVGSKTTASQSLAWPREVASSRTGFRGESMTVSIDSDGNPREYADNSGIPLELGYAVVELAVKLVDGDDVLAQPKPLAMETSDSVDVLSETRKYKAGYSEDANYGITLILRPILITRSGLTMTRGA